MATQPNGLVHSSVSKMVRLTLLTSLAVAVPLLTSSRAATTPESGQTDDEHAATPARLVQAVREATGQFVNVDAAISSGYGPFLGCVSGPDHGAMGVHYVNGALVQDGELDASRPEALIYEPAGDRLRLVGVEFIVDAAAWLAKHGAPPVLEGQTFQFVSSPNRYALPPFFELHVWAWRHNPNGAFVDWNARVTCERE